MNWQVEKKAYYFFYRRVLGFFLILISLISVAFLKPHGSGVFFEEFGIF